MQGRDSLTMLSTTTNEAQLDKLSAADQLKRKVVFRQGVQDFW